MALSSKRFTIDEILNRASERTGLSDFGDNFFREGLGVFIKALNEEARLNDIGAMIAENRMLGGLVNRLEMTHPASPELQTMHPSGAQLPQECGLMHCNDFASGSFGSMFRVPSYMAWYRTVCDLSKIYASQRRPLQLLQWRYKREHWVLKSPQHLANLDALVKEFPDALLIQTHRDPIKVVGSAASLVLTLRKMAADDVDLAEPAREWLHYQTTVLDRSVDFREKSGFNKNQVADILFHEFIPDPVRR